MGNQVFRTVINGTLVFVLGQIIQRFFLEPLQVYKKTIGEIDNKLKFYDNISPKHGFDQESIREAADLIRFLSCQLESYYKQMPLTGILSFFSILRSREEIAKVSEDLIFLSNTDSRNPEDILRCEEKIKEVREILEIEKF